MDPQDVERVKQLIRDELGPALEEAAREIEARMTAYVTAFQQQIRIDVEHHHGENRARLQLLYDQALEAAQKATLAAGDAAKAVAGTDYIVGRLDRQDERGRETHGIMVELLAKVNQQVGRIDGVAEADAKHEVTQGKRVGILKWGVGALSAGGAGKWIWTHWLSGWWSGGGGK